MNSAFKESPFLSRSQTAQGSVFLETTIVLPLALVLLLLIANFALGLRDVQRWKTALQSGLRSGLRSARLSEEINPEPRICEEVKANLKEAGIAIDTTRTCMDLEISINSLTITEGGYSYEVARVTYRRRISGFVGAPPLNSVFPEIILTSQLRVEAS